MFQARSFTAFLNDCLPHHHDNAIARPSAAPRSDGNPETFAALGESANDDDVLRFDAHALQRRQVRDRGDDEVTGVLEADETPVEQVVDAERQQPSILPIEPLIVR
jgi:hypothetical protein